MTAEQRSRAEYSALIARAFNGAITVDGQRIVAHPSGMLFARVPSVPPTRAATIVPDRENDWSDV